MIAALLLCALAATSVVAQDVDSLTLATIKPITLPTIGPPDVICPRPHFTADQAEEDEVTGQLERGEISVDEAEARIIPVPTARPILRCEDGPKRVKHTVPGEFHWPRIFKGSCNNLFCKDPPCFPKVQVWRSRCVLVFKWIKGRWVKIGFRIRRFLDHISCRCKECRDIRTRQQCIQTFPCPNSRNNCTFCYWIPSPFILHDKVAPATTQPAGVSDAVIAPIPIPFPSGRCDCCIPTCCPAPKRFNYDKCQCECPNRPRCPPDQVFNKETCKCECPKGSKLNANGKCIGDCEDIDLAWCKNVHCADNQHFRCKRVGYQCQCPSCDAAAEPAWCAKTKCLEQPSKPKCVTDSYTKKCRCPRCSDQTGTDPLWCRMVYCGPNNNTQCKWESAWRKCFCPVH